MTLSFTILGLPLLMVQMHAQTSAASQNPIEYLKMADSLYQEKNYDSSTNQIKKALTLYTAVNDISGMASCHNKVANNHIAQGEYATATSHLDSALTLFKSDQGADLRILGKYHFLSGQIEHLERNYEASSESLQKAFESYNSVTKVDMYDLALVNECQGANYYHLWNLGKAEEYFEKALEIYLSDKQANKDRISSCYSYLSRIYTRSEQHSKALTYNKKTLALNLKIYGEAHYQVGLAYAIMAITYGRMDDFDKSLGYFEKANHNFISNFGEGHRWVITTYENIGRAYNRLGDVDKSLENYKKAIKLGIRHLGEDDLVVAHVFLNAADTYATIGDSSKALELYQKALTVQKKAYGEKHREVAQNYIAQGNFYNYIQDYTSALKMFGLVIDTYKAEISRALTSGLIIEEINVFYKIVEAIEGKARSLKLQYENEGNLESLLASKEAYERAEALIEKMRLATTAHEDKTYLTSSNQVSLRGIIETSFLLSEQLDEKTVLHDAFSYSERNRARILQRVSQQNALTSSDKKLKELLENENILKEKKSLYLSKIENEKEDNPDYDPLKIDAYEEELFKINLQYDSLIHKIQQNYPNYFNVEFARNIDNLAEIQSRLDPNTTLLEYFVADSTTTYSFLVTHKKFVAKRLPTAELAQKVDRFKSAIIEKDMQSYKDFAAMLYDDLLAPIAHEFVGDKLIVIPDGPIWHINFELLLTSKNSSNNPKNFDYLLKDYTVSYANSAGLLLNTKSIEKTPENGVLAFSFSDSAHAGNTMSLATLRSRDDDLPGTRKEIKEIAKFIDGDYFFGNKAQEVNFKSRAINYQILHLALHGEVDGENPQNSRLYFTKGKDSLEDNILYGHELYNLDLPADLVVLSACNTGTGKITAGEGIMSLGNAFQYAGAKSLLISGWPVSDETTPELMKLFYGNLKDGMSKPKALQQAKLTYLEHADTFRSAPFYWGGFYLVGDTSPLHLGSSNNMLYIISGILLAIAIFFFLRRRYFTDK